MISVIIQSYNFAPYLGEAIRSVLDLRAPGPDEIVVIDDASTDGSAEIVRGFCDPRLRILENEKNLGAAAAFQRAFAQTRGRFVARLDGDDRYRPDFLRHAMDAFRRWPEAVAVYGRIAMIDSNGRVTSLARNPSLPTSAQCGDRFLDLLEDNFLSAPTLIARREAWQRALPVPPDMPFFDWYVALRIAQSGPLAFTNAIHADYRVHAGGMHVRMMQEGWGEAIYLRVLDTIFTEAGREKEKAARRGRIYGGWHRRIGDSYFGFGRLADARRCYLRALREDPWNRANLVSARRLLATWLDPAAYVRLKRVLGFGTRPT